MYGIYYRYWTTRKREKQLDTSGPLANTNVENSKDNYRYSTISFVFWMFTGFLCRIRHLSWCQKSQEMIFSDFSEILEMEQTAPCFPPHILRIWIMIQMHYDFWGPRRLMPKTSISRKFVWIYLKSQIQF